jgi:hypothetical protein
MRPDTVMYLCLGIILGFALALMYNAVVTP